MLRASPFTIAAYVTLLADAYLVLASLASRMMQEAYASYLLPFSGDNNSDETHFLVLIVATWTAILAVDACRHVARLLKAIILRQLSGSFWYLPSHGFSS